MHFGWIHLVGNMIFLWTFGLIVEGKVGWWRFLLLYLGIAVAGNAIEQTLLLGYNGLSTGSGGASQAIFGLIGVALIWAPENEIELMWVFAIGIFARAIDEFSVSIYVLAILYFLLEVLSFMGDDFGVGSAALHLLGAVVGVGAGVLMLKRDWVDCENWDLFSVWSNRHVTSGELPARDRGPVDEEQVEPEDVPSPVKLRITSLKRNLENEDYAAAFCDYSSLRTHGVRCPGETLQSLAAGLYSSKNWSPAMTVLDDYLQSVSRPDPIQVLRRAALAVKIESRPRLALRLLDGVAVGELPGNMRSQWERIRSKANELVDAGVMEIAG